MCIPYRKRMELMDVSLISVRLFVTQKNPPCEQPLTVVALFLRAHFACCITILYFFSDGVIIAP